MYCQHVVINKAHMVMPKLMFIVIIVAFFVTIHKGGRHRHAIDLTNQTVHPGSWGLHPPHVGLPSSPIGDPGGYIPPPVHHHRHPHPPQKPPRPIFPEPTSAPTPRPMAPAEQSSEELDSGQAHVEERALTPHSSGRIGNATSAGVPRTSENGALQRQRRRRLGAPIEDPEVCSGADTGAVIERHQAATRAPALHGDVCRRTDTRGFFCPRASAASDGVGGFSGRGPPCVPLQVAPFCAMPPTPAVVRFVGEKVGAGATAPCRAAVYVDPDTRVRRMDRAKEREELRERVRRNRPKSIHGGGADTDATPTPAAVLATRMAARASSNAENFHTHLRHPP